jgi:hypothetical protein
MVATVPAGFRALCTNYEVERGMNPGISVFTISLSLCLVVVRLI